MYYETRGSDQNPPIVLLHAFPLDHNVWKPQAEELSKKYWVITPDFRGHGKSEATNEPYSMDLLASDVKALVENLGVKNIVLGGISMGGYVAFAYRRLFPEDIRALILVDTKAEADTPQARLGRMEMADLVLKKGVASFADLMLPRLFSGQRLEANATIVKDTRRTIETMRPIGIVGEKDELTTVDDAKRMASRIVGSKLVIVPNAGHISTLEQPEKVTSAIQTFLREIPLPQRAGPA